MWPDRVTNPRPLAPESDMLPTALRGPAYLLIYVINALRTLQQYFSLGAQRQKKRVALL